MKTIAVLAGAFIIGLSAQTAFAQTADEKQAAAKAGETVFAQCRACHQTGDKARNGVGPKLNGLFGRKAGEIAGYTYSEANKNSGLTWDDATLDQWRHALDRPREGALVDPGAGQAGGLSGRCGL